LAARRRGSNGAVAVREASESTVLGQRLREERDDRGLSLRELARRLEVSPSLLSQIETGKIQPSVRTLYAIVSELGVSLDEVFAPKRPGPARRSKPRLATPVRATDDLQFPPVGEARIQRATQRPAIHLGSGVRWERLTAWNDHEVDFLCMTYEVGGASSPDGEMMRHNGREFGVVVSGRLNVTVGFEEYVLEPGDSIAFESSTPHRLRNDGDDDVHAVWVVLGRHVDGNET
jgi:transcriptional regulator with XRE-family HTH domain